MSDMRVMAVDDEVDFVETLVKRFGRRQISLTGLSSGLEALKALEREPFDVVILDVKMPGMDGIETLKEIKRRFPLVEVIMLTGHASVDSGVQGMTLGAYDYVMKPVDLDDLVAKVRKAHERKLLAESRAS